MIFKEFVHIGIGDTGEGMIRAGIQGNFINTGRLIPIDTAAHMSLDYSKRKLEEVGIERMPPVITGVRNPWDWRVSFYIHWLRALRYQGTFAEFALNFDPGHGFGVPIRFTDYFYGMGCHHADFTVKFENFKEGVITAFCAIGLETRESMLENWFPAVYRCWGGAGHAWLENVEQNLRAELYGANPGLAEMVYDLDREIIDNFGYKFDDYYMPPVSPWVEGGLRGSGKLWHTLPDSMRDK